MTINKYIGKTEEEAKQKARDELGSAAVIMNIKEIKPKGITGMFKSSTYEVTAAIEDEGFSNDAKNFATYSGSNSNQPQQARTSTFEAVADEDDAKLLKDAFSAVNEVLEKQDYSSSNVRTEEMPAIKLESVEIKPMVHQSGESFEPLSDFVPKAKIIEPTYSRPSNTPIMPTQNSKPTIKTEVPEKSLEEALSAKTRVTFDDNSSPAEKTDNQVFVKTLYNVLLDNEVQEKYINQVLDDMDKLLSTSHSVDNLLSSVYQKMVLKLGTPATITAGERKPKVVFFIGPTGVGKTTTIAKIASKFKVEEGKKVGLITADTYRMAAANQLQTYANILGVPLNVIYSAEELLDTVKKQARENDDLELILVDTIGFSHKNEEQRSDTQKLLNSLNGFYDSEVYLVLSATTKHKDLMEIADTYKAFCDFNLIFTKLDETKSLGNIFNMKLYTKASLSYITCGQNVPDDIEVVNAQKLVKQLLGGN